MAPGLSYRYRNAQDFAALERKLLGFAALGCEEAVLLMDDIPVELPKADAGTFHSLGEAHALLLRRLQERLCRRGGLRRLWFCPTVYSDFFARDGVEGDAYLRDLAAGMPQGMPWMWTGPTIVSKSLAPREFAPAARLMGRRPVLWDNLYANDYCPSRIFLGPFRERPATLLRAASGLMLNPTGLFHTDACLLDLLGGFLRGENAAATWKAALQSRGVPREFFAVAPLLSSPFDAANPRAWSAGKVESLRRALKPLIWDWKSPLQREWYPHLFMLDAELRLLGGEIPDAPWVRKKYPTVLSHLLLENPALRG
jgi:protein O-GlcNAcase/histone acetyltransferase